MIQNRFAQYVKSSPIFLQTITEFVAACKTAALAVSNGLIAPLAIGDPAQAPIYVYNGIFFSKAEDPKDVFKVCMSKW